jgi:hypothetical protein
MSKHSQHVLAAILILGLAAITCTIPLAAKEPEAVEEHPLSDQEIADTAVAKVLTETARAAPIATLAAPTTTATPVPTQCNGIVTANMVANVRTGPGTGYDISGNLPMGGTALVAGRNDAMTWWYIQFAGGYGWIAGSVVTPSCIPTVVQVVAAPPLPTAPATATLVPLLQLAPGLHLHVYWSPTPVPLLQLAPGLQLHVYWSPTPP